MRVVSVVKTSKFGNLKAASFFSNRAGSIEDNEHTKIDFTTLPKLVSTLLKDIMRTYVTSDS